MNSLAPKINSLTGDEEPSAEGQPEANADTTDRQEEAPFYVRRIAEKVGLLGMRPEVGQEVTGPGESEAALTAAADDPRILTFPTMVRGPQKRPTAVRVPLQEWEGFVVSIGRDSFTATLRDVTEGRPYEDEEADFSLEEVSPEDRDLLRTGAIFRWLIAYKTNDHGRHETVSQIIFRRMPQWTDAEIQEAKLKAKEKVKSIRWE
jgi:hypothetical protein